MKRTYLLILILGSIVILILFLLLINGARNNSSNQTNQPSGSDVATDLELQIYPPPQEKVAIGSSVTLNFNEPVDLANLYLSVVPDDPITLQFENNNKTLIVSPLNTWKYNKTYLLLVKSATQSINGAKINKDFTFVFETEPFEGL